MLYTNANMQNAKMALFRSNLNGYSTERMCFDTVIFTETLCYELEESILKHAYL